MGTLHPPHPEQLANLQQLCEYAEPYKSETHLDNLFIEAFKEIIIWHRKHNTFFDILLKKNDFKIESVKQIQDLHNFPFIHANFFKLHETLSVERQNIEEHLTSSGTTGQKSQMFFDKWSIQSARRMVRYIYDKNGFNTPDKKVNFLLFAYEPLSNFKVGTTNTNIFLTSFAKKNNLFFALRALDNSHEFDKFGTIEKLQEFEKEGLPVRIHGFPSFMYFTLKLMNEKNITLKLNPESLVMFGGGWKGYANQKIPKEQLYQLINKTLGIPLERIRDSYGSVEHSIPYLECSHHRMHVPIWSRLFIRDLKTFEVLGFEKPGFMHFVTPYITSVPAISVMMGDLGILHPVGCECGAETPFFEIIGRAGLSKNKSCAISAAELLKKQGV
jgi:phenylacetate-coenzyme A ligase PaaK-like adenylate-forming protein